MKSTKSQEATRKRGSAWSCRSGGLAGLLIVAVVWLPATAALDPPTELASPNEEKNGYFGFSVSGVPDVDGDGCGDVIVGAHLEDPGVSPSDAGRAYIYLSEHFTVVLDSTEGGSVTLPGEAPYDFATPTAKLITASAESGYGFSEWTCTAGITIATPTAASTFITWMPQDSTVMAHFEQPAIDAWELYR